MTQVLVELWCDEWHCGKCKFVNRDTPTIWCALFNGPINSNCNMGFELYRTAKCLEAEKELKKNESNT